MFPGQGSQYNGMFKEHFSEFIEFCYLNKVKKVNVILRLTIW